MSWQGSHLLRALRHVGPSGFVQRSHSLPPFALGHPYLPSSCSCQSSSVRTNHASAALLDPHQMQQPSSYVFASSSTSNLDIHPTPVDSSLFEDAYMDHPGQTKAQDATNEQKAPPHAALLQQILATDGPDHYISPKQLGEAYLILQQLKELHSDIGPPHVCYFHAAFASFPHRKISEALDWLAMMPFWSHVSSKKRSREAISAKIEKLLHWAISRATTQPQTLYQVLEILYTKRWHSQPSLGQIFATATATAFVTGLARPGIYNLWSRLAPAMDLPGSGILERRTVMRDVYNRAIRTLALNKRFEDAAKMILLSHPSHTTWYPWVAVFTWKVLLEEMVDSPSSESGFLAEALHTHFLSIQEHLRKASCAQNDASVQPAHVEGDKSISSPMKRSKKDRLLGLQWSERHVSNLLKLGRPLVDQLSSGDPLSPSDATSNPTLLRQATHREEIEMRGGTTPQDPAAEPADVATQDPAVDPADPNAVYQLLRQLERSDELGYTIVTAIASHQLRVLVRSGLDPDAPLPSKAAPEDLNTQRVLRKGKGTRGLWETSYLWLLNHRRQYRDAIYYFMNTWHLSEDVTTELLEQVLGEKIALTTSHDFGAKDTLLQPSSHTLNLLNACIVEELSAGLQDYKKAVEEHLELLQAIGDRLDGCYRTWMTSLLRMQSSGRLGMTRLSSYSFDPWIRSSLAQAARISGIVTQKSDLVSDAANLLSEITVFKDFTPPDEWDAQNMYIGSYKILHFLRDMQNLGVKPSLATYTIMLDALARDPISSWPLAEYLCRHLGMVPVSHDATDATKAGHATLSDPSWRKESYLIAFSGLLRGLQGVPSRLGGKFAAVAQAKQVREWLKGLTVPEDEEHSTKGEEDHGHGTFMFTADDLYNDEKLVALLRQSLELEQEWIALQRSSSGRSLGWDPDESEANVRP